MSTSTYIVPQELLARCIGREDLVRRVMAAFLTQLDDDLPKLREAVQQSDSAGVAPLAHRLKGAAANVSAEPIRVAAESLEQAARAELTPPATETFTEMWESLSASVEDYRRSTDEFLQA